MKINKQNIEEIMNTVNSSENDIERIGEIVLEILDDKGIKLSELQERTLIAIVSGILIWEDNK